MSSQWQIMCVESAQRPVDEFNIINYWTTGVLVACFFATGSACGRRCWQWMLLPSAAKRELWELYGTFCLMGTLGCASGIAAFVCLMLGNMFAYRTARAQLLTTKYFRNLAHFEILYAVYTTFYAIQFCCLGLAKLAVLDRLLSFIQSVFSPVERDFLHRLQRIFLAFVISLNVVGVAASVTAIVFGVRASEAGNAAAALVNSSQASILAVEQLKNQDRAAFAVGVQMWAEVVALLMAIVAFVFLGTLCARRLRAANKFLDATQDTTPIRSTRAAGLILERQITATVGVVFVTYLIRAAFAILNAWAWMAPENTDNINPDCDIVDQCNACQTDRFYMKIWLFNTPEVNAITIFLSSPVALAVSLWGMTSSKIRQALAQAHGGSLQPLLLQSSSSMAALPVVTNADVRNSSSGPSSPSKRSGSQVLQRARV